MKKHFGLELVFQHPNRYPPWFSTVFKHRFWRARIRVIAIEIKTQQSKNPKSCLHCLEDGKCSANFFPFVEVLALNGIVSGTVSCIPPTSWHRKHLHLATFSNSYFAHILPRRQMCCWCCSGYSFINTFSWCWFDSVNLSFLPGSASNQFVRVLGWFAQLLLSNINKNVHRCSNETADLPEDAAAG